MVLEQTHRWVTMVRGGFAGKGEAMRQLLNGNKVAGLLVAGFLITAILVAAMPVSALEALDDQELASVDAQAGPVTISVENDTVRLFFDTYIETYAEVDKVRMGFYYKDQKDLVTRKGLNPGIIKDPLIGDNYRAEYDERITWLNGLNDPHQLYQMDYTGYENTDGVRGSMTPSVYAMEYQLAKKHDGHLKWETEFVPWTDDDLYMAKYKDKLGVKWVDGAQGDNAELYNFSSKTYQNRGYLDWDISLDNVRLGSSPDSPAKINGLVMRLKYDDLDSDDPKLTDIIIGTNDMQADLMVDFKRATGFYSAKNAYRSRRKTLQTGGGLGQTVVGTDLGQEFGITPVPVILQRDSMLMLVDHFYFGRHYRDPKGESFMSAVPDNPTSNSSHGGIFLRIGLDRQSPHFGYQVITGYNEQVATSFQYRGEHLNESLYNWWNDNAPSPETLPLPFLFPTYDAYS